MICRPWCWKKLVCDEEREGDDAGATMTLLILILLLQLPVLISLSSNHLIFIALRPPITICPPGSNTYISAVIRQSFPHVDQTPSTTQPLPHPPIRPLSPFSSLCFSYFPVSHSTTLCVPLYTFSLPLFPLSFWLNYHKCRSWAKICQLVLIKTVLVIPETFQMAVSSLCVWGWKGGEQTQFVLRRKMQPDNIVWWKIKRWKPKNKMGDRVEGDGEAVR